MKYYYIPKNEPPKHGTVHVCSHPLYDKCTLYLKDGLGLAVVQLKFNERSKTYYWDRINHALANDIYENPKFEAYFALNARLPEEDIYPTVNVRSLMWDLRMKPLKKEWWESENLNK